MSVTKSVILPNGVVVGFWAPGSVAIDVDKKTATLISYGYLSEAAFLAKDSRSEQSKSRSVTIDINGNVNFANLLADVETALVVQLSAEVEATPKGLAQRAKDAADAASLAADAIAKKP